MGEVSLMCLILAATRVMLKNRETNMQDDVEKAAEVLNSNREMTCFEETMFEVKHK